MTEPPNGLDAITALTQPTRRALYHHVVAIGDWVGRDAAADAIGIERGTAAHHLDRLVADGLLEVDYRRLSGRRGPGAGRPAKLYRRAHRDITVTLPPRDYALAAGLLAEAADRARTTGCGIVDALDDVAGAHGRRLADDVRARARQIGARSTTARRQVLLEALTAQGFAPRATDEGTVVLGNCPFDQLAREHPALVCGMNLCLMSSAVDRVEGARLAARLEPEDGLCCVRLHPRG